jgi:hypothetical protein
MKQTDKPDALDLHALGAAIGAAVAQGIAATAPPPVLTEADPAYIARQHAEGWFDSFEKPVYQNGYEAQARGLSPLVRTRAAALQSGRYLNGRVTVEATEKGVWLIYPTKGDALLRNQQYWRDFEDLITQLWTEMTARGVPA